MGTRPWGFESPLSHAARTREDNGSPPLPGPCASPLARHAAPLTRSAALLRSLVPLALAAAFVPLVGGCAVLGLSPPSSPERVSQRPYALADRPPDRLLSRPDLQAVVDLQVRRDAAGLVRLLSHRDSVVRARAAFALGSVQGAEAVAALQGLLADPVPAVRADAAFALGQAADSTSGVALIAALRTEATAAVQVELVDALGKIGMRPDLDGVLDVTLPAEAEPARGYALARMAQRSVSSPASWAWLAARLQAGDPALREAAAYAFSRAGASAWGAQTPAVRRAFDGLVGDAGRMSLARALGRRGDAEDVGRLTRALASDPDWRNRQAAAAALGAFSTDATARAALWTAVGAPPALVAQTAAGVLARAADAPGADAERAAGLVAGDAPWPVQAALLPLLARAGRTDAVVQWADRQSNTFARAAAVTALGQADDGASLSRLFAASADADAALAAAAIGALTVRWAVDPSRDARRYYDAFAAGLARADLATTSAAAPILADSAFAPFGAGAELRRVYAQFSAPADLEPMVEIVRAAGQVRDGDEIEFLVGIALESPHPSLREAARDALNDRLIEGIDVSLAPGAAPTSATTSIDWAHLAGIGPHPRLVLVTDRGRIVIRMDAEQAPQTVQLITTTAARGRYDGVPFHRVLPNFVAQGGDFYRRDGYGGPDVPIRSEFGRARYRTGTVGMASAGKDTEGVQFFVTHSPQPHLDGRHTIIGQVVEGQDVVDQLIQGDLVREARIERDRARER